MLYVTFALEIVIMVGLPVYLWLVVRRWDGVTWGLIVAGALTFIASQVVHLPLNWATGLLGGGRGIALWPTWAMATAGGLSAGLCEEIARYLAFRFWRRQARSWKQGVAFGAGHGGIESVITGLLVLVTLINMIAVRNMDLGTLGLDAATLEQAQAQVAAFWATPWYMPLLGAAERVFAMTMHIAWSLLVLRAVTRRNLLWLALAVLGHALVDGLAVYLIKSGVSAVTIEGLLFILALGAGAVILALRRDDDVSRETLPETDVTRTG